MPFDALEHGQIKSSDGYKATLTNVPEGDIPDCDVRQPLGLDARPRAGKADALYAGNGDACEVVTYQDVAAAKALVAKAGVGDKAEGETRLHSTGADPQGVSVIDKKIVIGLGGPQKITIDGTGATPVISVGQAAVKGGARLDDEVEVTLYLNFVVLPGPVTVVKDIQATPNLGYVPLVVKGKITKASTVVKVE